MGKTSFATRRNGDAPGATTFGPAITRGFGVGAAGCVIIARSKRRRSDALARYRGASCQRKAPKSARLNDCGAIRCRCAIVKKNASRCCMAMQGDADIARPQRHGCYANAILTIGDEIHTLYAIIYKHIQVDAIKVDKGKGVVLKPMLHSNAM